MINIKNIKKIPSILAAAACCCFITGCGDGGGNSGDSGDGEQTSSKQPPQKQSFSKQSPSGVVQAWIAALEAGDLEKANSFSVDEGRERNAEVEKLKKETGRRIVPKLAVKREIIESDNRVFVALSVQKDSIPDIWGPLGQAESWSLVRLEKVDGAWKVESFFRDAETVMQAWIAAIEAGDLDGADLLSSTPTQKERNAKFVETIKSGKKLPNIAIKKVRFPNPGAVEVDYCCEVDGMQGKNGEAIFSSDNYANCLLAESGKALDAFLTETPENH